MWQRFTERARRIVLLAQEEAGKMNAGHVGTEHLLLGLVRENEGVAAQVLRKMGVNLAQVRIEIENEVQRNSSEARSTEPKLTPKAKHVLELSADEARRMRHSYIGTEHLLLGLLREENGLGASILRRLGLSLEKARAEVMNYLSSDKSEFDDSDEPQITFSPTPTPVDQRARPGKVSFGYEPTSTEGQIARDLVHFVDNLNAGLAFPNNLELVFGARKGYYGANEWADTWNQERLQRQIEVRDITVSTPVSTPAPIGASVKASVEAFVEAKKAQAAVYYGITSAQPHLTPLLNKIHSDGWTEILDMKQGVGWENQLVWQIVPADQFPLPDKIFTLPLLAQAAFALAQKVSEEPVPNQASRSIIHLKQLGLAAFQFSANWKGIFAFSPRYMEEALLPYLASSESLTVPNTGEKFVFNANLCEVEADSLAQPAQTVLFYEGEAETLRFRYDGRAAVAFADGRCVLISPEEAAALIWNP